MKIVDRETFLKMPHPTLYSYFDGVNFSTLSIFGGAEANGGFAACSVEDAIDMKSGEDFFEALGRQMKEGTIHMDFEGFGRDAMFEEDLLFAVWEPEDLRKFAVVLLECLRAVKS